MQLRPYKLLVQVVVQELDDEGAVVGERLTDPIPIYTPTGERLAAWWADFERQLQEALAADAAPADEGAR